MVMRLLTALFVTLIIPNYAHAQAENCGALGASPGPGEIKLVSWNIAELASKVQVYDRPIRSEAEFEDLRMYRACHDADVYALQEIASLRALARVFSPSDYIFCISGQTIADQRGLSPDYPRDQLGGIGPQCVTDGSTAIDTLPEELTTPAKQYVALAVKRASQIELATAGDLVDLGVKDPNTGQAVRWGLDVSLRKGGSALRILVVHLKSRCTTEPIEEPSSSVHCPALSRQLPYLKRWILDASLGGDAFAVIGDFNRRLDVESLDVKATDMWDVITGASTPAPTDDLQLTHVPTNKEFKCWPTQPADERFAIDFFVLNKRAAASADTASYWKWRYGKDVAANTPRSKWPSDHCAIQLNVKFPN